MENHMCFLMTRELTLAAFSGKSLNYLSCVKNKSPQPCNA